MFLNSEKISFRYVDEKIVLDNISFRLKKIIGVEVDCYRHPIMEFGFDSILLLFISTKERMLSFNRFEHKII